jgi:hypothetical protein
VLFFKYRNISAFVGISWNIEIEMHGVTVKIMGIFSISKLQYLQALPNVLCALLLNKKIFKSITEAQAR